jgi:hypothetical protein
LGGSGEDKMEYIPAAKGAERPPGNGLLEGRGVGDYVFDLQPPPRSSGQRRVDPPSPKEALSRVGAVAPSAYATDAAGMRSSSPKHLGLCFSSRGGAPPGALWARSSLGELGGVVGMVGASLAEAEAAMAAASERARALDGSGKLAPLVVPPWLTTEGAPAAPSPLASEDSAGATPRFPVHLLGNKRLLGTRGHLDSAGGVAAFSFSAPTPPRPLTAPLSQPAPPENLPVGTGLEPSRSAPTLLRPLRTPHPAAPPDHVKGSVGAFITGPAPVPGLLSPNSQRPPPSTLDAYPGGLIGHLRGEEPTPTPSGGAGAGAAAAAGGAAATAGGRAGAITTSAGGTGELPRAAMGPRAGRLRRNFAGSAIATLLEDIAVESAAAQAVGEAFSDARRRIAVEAGYSAKAPPRLAAHVAAAASATQAAVAAAAAVAATTRRAAAAAAGDGSATDDNGGGGGGGGAGAFAAGRKSSEMYTHGTPSVAAMAAAAASGTLAGSAGSSSSSSAGSGAATAGSLEALRSRLRATLPANPIAAHALLRHRLRVLDGDSDGVIQDDDLLRVVTEAAVGDRGGSGSSSSSSSSSGGGGGTSGIEGEGWGVGSVALPAVVGLLVRDLRGREGGGGSGDPLAAGSAGGAGGPSSSSSSSAANTAPSALYRVPGVRSENFVAWVLGSETPGRAPVALPWATTHIPTDFPPIPTAGEDSGSSSSSSSSSSSGGGSSGGAAEVPAAAPTEPAGAGAGGGGAKRAAKVVGRPVFEGDTPEARFASFRSHWEGRHGAAAKKELAMDREVAPMGPTWASAAPREFRVVHLAAPPPLAR